MIDDSDAAARVEGEGEPCSPPSPAAASTTAVDEDASAPSAAAIPAAAAAAAPSATAVSPHCTIIVLGDVGRSPRMQYHADAITKQPLTADEKHWTVELVGYEGSAVFDQLASNPRVTLTRFPAAASLARDGGGLTFLVRAAIKLAAQLYQLGCLLLFGLSARPDVILVQNPPSIPTLLLARLAAWRHSAALIVDWHNYGWSILAMGRQADSPVVRLARLYEEFVGGCADGHLVVTEAMGNDLRARTLGAGAAPPRVLHDRAQPSFRRTTAAEAHQLFLQLLLTPAAPASGDKDDAIRPPLREDEFAEWMRGDPQRMQVAHGFTGDQIALSAHACAASAPAEPGKATPFTFLEPLTGEALWRPDRPALVVSSTSWTADEDFSLFAQAIIEHDRAIDRSRGGDGGEGQGAEGQDEEEQEEGDQGEGSTLSNRKSKKLSSSASSSLALSSSSSAKPSPLPARPLPRVVYIITGKGGSLRDDFLRTIAAHPLKHSKVLTLFASYAHYRGLLGAADLGVSLHRSSSGLDLPMKVVDMFGAGLPVCAVHFNCLSELVTEGVNGRIFGRPAAASDSSAVVATSGAAEPADASASDAATAAASASSAAPAAAAAPLSPASELASQFSDLFSDFPADDDSDECPSASQLATLRRGARAWAAVTWQQEWNAACRPLLRPLALKALKEHGQSQMIKAFAILLMVIGGLLIMM